MTQRSTGPACGNNPNFRMSDGDRKAVADFKARLALQAAVKPYVDAAAWVDGDPLMEVIAATVWKHCARDDQEMPQAVCDDPRTIAAFAAAVARAHAAAAPSSADRAAEEPCVCGEPERPDTVHRTDGPCYVADRAALRERIADAIARVDAGSWGTETEAMHPYWQKVYRAYADAVLAVLPEPDKARTTWTPGPVAVAQAGEAARTTAAAYLVTPCDTCEHTLNWHRNDVGCTVTGCACSRFTEEKPC